MTELQKQARLYRDQGLEFQNQGDIDSAFTFYQKAVILDPNFAIAYNDLGIIFEAKGDPKKAEEMYLKAIEIDNYYLESYTNLALLYEGQKDYAQAILYWLKRAMLGYIYDPWTEKARERIESITQTYPEEFRKIEKQYQESLQQLEESQVLLEEPEIIEPLAGQQPWESSKGQLYSEELQVPQPQAQEPLETKKTENRARALQHMAAARENYARGEYVAALKEATTAEYLDSSNREISAFVEKIRRALLR